LEEGSTPPVHRVKRSKNKKTIFRESIGADNWENFKKFIEDEGAEKLIIELKKINGARYVHAYSIVAEYVKPKLSRVDPNIKSTIEDLRNEDIVFE
jgi:hypothetical protein